MNRRKRIEYLAVTASMFISVTLLLYYVGEFSSTVPVENETLFKIVGSLNMGYLFTGILSGIMLAAGFFARRRLRFKVIAAALWLVTLFAVFGVGVFGLIPYQIYNLIRIIRDRPAAEEYAEEAPAHAEDSSDAF